MVASHAKGWLWDAIERQRAVGTQQIWGFVPKGTHSMAAIYPAIDMTGYHIKPLWGIISLDVSITYETLIINITT